MPETGPAGKLRNLARVAGFQGSVRRLLASLRASGAAVLVAGAAAALLGPLVAVALAAGAGSQPPAATVTVTTPCSGSVPATSTASGPATTTTVLDTATSSSTSTIAGTTTTSTTPTTTSTTPTTTGTTQTTTGTTQTSTGTTTSTTPTNTGTTNAGTTTTTTTGTTPTLTVVTTTVVTTTVTVTTPGTTTVTETPACTVTAPAPTTLPVPPGNPFRGRALWIWQLRNTEGGHVAAIIAQAKRYGITALYIKSGDGTQYWPQFSPALVAELHRAGIRVCAWQYVYGARPIAEADVGARAVRAGASCLVIDAESQYQGRYLAAQTYITRLRRLIGPRFPVGLASFPYVGYHLAFPYSVFLGPGGAQYNLPQMYWADIGTSVQNVYAITYEYNEIYRRPIFPLGQLWNSGRGMSPRTIEQFGLLARQYGASGVSWWDWQSAPRSYFAAIARTSPAPARFVTNRTPVSIFRGNRGDLVIWAQEHLYGAGYRIAVNGVFGPQMQSAVRAFQRTHGLAATGVLNGLTWDALLRTRPATVRWTRERRRTVAIPGSRRGHIRLGAGGAVGASTVTETVPSWMTRLAPRNELHADFGAGTPPAASARR